MILLHTRPAAIATFLQYPRLVKRRRFTMHTTTEQEGGQDGDAVLITGGAGFLGQHIVSLLQTRADHVREIRVLDLKRYRNNLDHEERKPITSIVGSVTDPVIMKRACKGVRSVYHIAGLISYGTFPDYNAMKSINVQGTANVIAACKHENVSRLICCSTVDVVIGHDEIIEGTEENTVPPKEYLFPGYPESKYKAECLVLRANGTKTEDGEVLSTVSLRANVMYGEEDPYYVTNGLRNAAKSGKILFQVGDGTAKFQPVYVGNSAWAFLCADAALRQQPSLGGQYFFIPDETPVQNTFHFMRPFLELRGFRLSSFSLPYDLVYNLILLVESVVKFLSPFLKVRLPTESYTVRYVNTNLFFKNTKAKQVLKFTPIFTPSEAINNCLKYYKNVKL